MHSINGREILRRVRDGRTGGRRSGHSWGLAHVRRCRRWRPDRERRDRRSDRGAVKAGGTEAQFPPTRLGRGASTPVRGRPRNPTATFGDKLSEKATASWRGSGSRSTGAFDRHAPRRGRGVDVKGPDGLVQRYSAKTKIWAAGARAKDVNVTYVSRILRLTLLAPDVVEAILDGRQSAELQLDDLLEGFPAVLGRAIRPCLRGTGPTKMSG